MDNANTTIYEKEIDSLHSVAIKYTNDTELALDTCLVIAPTIDDKNKTISGAMYSCNLSRAELIACHLMLSQYIDNMIDEMQ